MFKSQATPPVLTPLRKTESWSSIKTHDFFPTGLPVSLKDLRSQLAWMSLVGCCSFLESVMLAEKLVPYANYSLYDNSKLGKVFMTLDARALEHLEILDASNGVTRTKDGSLFEFIDKTSTVFGRRLLRRWLCAPLTHPDAINSRLDAVQELISRFDVVRQFDRDVKALP
jgi:DNA mismatch repair protein MSH6